MKNKKKKIIKRTRKEEIEFRKLQKAIASLPKPSFNNPEKVQPTSDVIVPTAVPATLQENTPIFVSPEEKEQKVLDKSIILDTVGLRIEKVAKIKKTKKKSTIKRIFRYLKPNIWYLVGAIVFALINSGFEILIPLFIGREIDCIIGIGSVDFDGLTKYSIFLGLSIVGFAVCKWLTNKFSNTLSYKIEEQLHNDIFNKFNKVPLKYIDGSSHGDLQSRMINDVDNLTDGFVLGLTSFFDCLTTIVLTITFMYLIHPIIATVIVALTPISVLVAFFIAKKTNKMFKRQAKQLGDMSGTIVEMLGNQKIITAFQYEANSIEKFDDINKKLTDSTEKAEFYSSTTGPVSRFINGLIYAIVAIMGTIYAINSGMSIGSITTLLSYANKYTKPFNEISEVFTDIQSAFASASRIFNVLDIENEVSDKGMLQLKHSKGNVEFENVDFSYSPNTKLIQNLNVSVAKGQKVAIVGPTGCGKSTIINLLMRFYDVDKGQIVVSDHPIKTVTRASLRSHFGMVLQETWLFSASIRDNIAYGKQDATDKEIQKAARLAGVDHFIQTLPNGYDTIINENGDNLSQGQKQLICIARLMLTKPSMLILDEATSNIDTRTELAIQAAFNKMMEGKTSFVVAHRLSTITSSDIILVMNKGNIIEQGSHKELLAKQGFYYNLYNSQFSKY